MGQSCCSAEAVKHNTSDTKKWRIRTRNETEMGECLSDSEPSEHIQDESHVSLPSRPAMSTTFSSILHLPREEVVKQYMDAIKNGNDSLAICLIEEYPSYDLLDITFDNGCYALQTAVKNFQYALIVSLLTYGASPNQQSSVDGSTALHEAVQMNNIKLVTLLCKFGADPQITNYNHETPLSVAKQKHFDDVVEFFAFTQTDRKSLAPKPNNLDVTRTRSSNLLQTGSPSMDEASDDELSESEQMGPQPRDTFIRRESMNKHLSPALDDEHHTEDNDTDYETDVDLDPFIDLKRVKTQTALAQIKKITSTKTKLPRLKGWMMKQQNKMPYKWQRRYVIVKDGYFLWAENKIRIDNARDIKQRQMFNNSINIMTIKRSDIRYVYKGKPNKFIITITLNGPKQKTKDYLWKCKNERERLRWVDGLKKHVHHIKSVVKYLEN